MVSVEHSLKPKHTNHHHQSLFSSSPNLMSCDKSGTAIIDVILLIAVIGASGFLLFPYCKIVTHEGIEFIAEAIDALSEEIVAAPMVFGCLGLSFLLSITALTILLLCTDGKCGRKGCRGLKKSAEFYIQLEPEESASKKQGLGKRNQKGALELRLRHRRELEAELKKMAPPNGKAVLIYRARCGCSIGRMEVPGRRKFGKIKK